MARHRQHLGGYTSVFSILVLFLPSFQMDTGQPIGCGPVILGRKKWGDIRIKEAEEVPWGHQG